MKATNSNAIGNWLSHIEDGSLCLPRFQRENVWTRKKVCQFLETLIIDTNSPIGVLLVLSTDPTDTAFPPRTIDGTISEAGVCDKLLLDGQQRLTALWEALIDSDSEDGDRYYVVFNANYKVTDVKGVKKATKANQRLSLNPTRECAKKQFPATLLNPLVDSRVVDTWVNNLEEDKLVNLDIGKVKSLIMDTRKVFFRKARGGKIIPHFSLGSATDSKKAIEIYTLINTNLVRLSDHYLAVAQMEDETDQSLYEMAERLTAKVPSLKSLETDEIGELILKISCLLQKKPVSGGSFKSLLYSAVVADESIIFDGVEWAVGCLSNLRIWHGGQLPSVVPLRVLPALHQYMPTSGAALRDANQLVNRYLWHCFLTDRYDRQANDRLKADFEKLALCLQGRLNAKKIGIFKKADHPVPNLRLIEAAGWPSSRSVLARGTALLCCEGGAKALQSEEDLSEANYPDREKHHIFPRSILADKLGHPGLYAINCIPVPEIDNDSYSNALPGDYIKQAVIEGNPSLAGDEEGWRAKAKDILATHMISEKCAEVLFHATAENCKAKKNLKATYEKFMNERAKFVHKAITEKLQ